jgi:hypothetical protein
MAECPIKPKTSDLSAPTMGKGIGKPKYLSPKGLANLQGCSERTIRTWCKRGFISEAYKTPGGHCRILMPLSVKTRHWLETRSDGCPFDDNVGDFRRKFAPEFAEWLMLAQLYEQRLDQDFPVPTIAELGDTLRDGKIADTSDQRAIKARQIQDEIMQRLEAGKPFSDLILMGLVYQFWHEKKRRPTVAEIAELMGLSRPAFYRRHTRAELYRALRVACGRVEAHLPDPDGLDAVQKANRKAKKPNFASL